MMRDLVLDVPCGLKWGRVVPGNMLFFLSFMTPTGVVETANFPWTIK